MQNFIDRIKNFKKGEEIDINVIDELINQRDKKEKEKENRMQEFFIL